MIKDLNLKFIICQGLILAFFVNTIGFVGTSLAQDFALPTPGHMVPLSHVFNPPILKGIKVHPENPFKFDFILDAGDGFKPSHDGRVVNAPLQEEATRLIKYFLASLTVPEQDLWVNLSPYEKNRIIPDAFGSTEMGRDLLAEDYMLKQITASLMYPEGETGKRFWKRVYQEAAKKYGTTNIPVNTFNKVWIVPDKAIVYENAKAATAYVVKAKLKVMLQEDYLSLSKHIVGMDLVSIRHDEERTDTRSVPTEILREIVIPELTREVNEGRNFAQLRQVYNSLILADWYKKKIRDSVLATIYKNKNKSSSGSSLLASNDVELIYQRYLQSFKKGAYNYIKEESLYDSQSQKQEILPRKYFSGGLNVNAKAMDQAMTITNQGLDNINDHGQVMLIHAQLIASFDQAMASNIPPELAFLLPEQRVNRLYRQSFGGLIRSARSRISLAHEAIGILEPYMFSNMDVFNDICNIGYNLGSQYPEIAAKVSRLVLRPILENKVSGKDVAPFLNFIKSTVVFHEFVDYLGVFEKNDFDEATLDKLINAGILENVSSSEVRLRVKLKKSEGKVRGIVKVNFNQAWKILNHPRYPSTLDENSLYVLGQMVMWHETSSSKKLPNVLEAKALEFVANAGNRRAQYYLVDKRKLFEKDLKTLKVINGINHFMQIFRNEMLAQCSYKEPKDYVDMKKYSSIMFDFYVDIFRLSQQYTDSNALESALELEYPLIRLGIKKPFFWNKELRQEIIRNRLMNENQQLRPVQKSTAIFIFPSVKDPDQNFDRLPFLSEMSHKYHVLYYEVSSADDVIKALQDGTRHGKASLVLFRLDKEQRLKALQRPDFLTLADADLLQSQDLDTGLERDAKIILTSVGTSKKEYGKEAMADMLARVFKRAVYAPDGDGSIEGIYYSKDGVLSGINYVGATNQHLPTYIAKPLVKDIQNELHHKALAALSVEDFLKELEGLAITDELVLKFIELMNLAEDPLVNNYFNWPLYNLYLKSIQEKMPFVWTDWVKRAAQSQKEYIKISLSKNSNLVIVPENVPPLKRVNLVANNFLVFTKMDDGFVVDLFKSRRVSNKKAQGFPGWFSDTQELATIHIRWEGGVHSWIMKFKQTTEISINPRVLTDIFNHLKKIFGVIASPDITSPWVDEDEIKLWSNLLQTKPEYWGVDLASERHSGFVFTYREDTFESEPGDEKVVYLPVGIKRLRTMPGYFSSFEKNIDFLGLPVFKWVNKPTF